MVAVALVFGRLTARDYEDDVAADPRIDALRERMNVREDERFSRDYLDPDKRAIGNAVQIFFADGSATEKVSVEYPLGHRRRRSEAAPMLQRKFDRAVDARFESAQAERIRVACENSEGLEAMAIDEFVDLWLV